ncbi:MAG: hypothetical protein RL742_1881, partial [Bacteroidota bacterium]
MLNAKKAGASFRASLFMQLKFLWIGYRTRIMVRTALSVAVS